ncbi:DUF190 domain-containing protein [Streptomyces sp. DSM 41527]|uniref:DUF190 domain-containing protein n=1 Tax=Streptomyces mooreae TaxID=3075523 RepID=A0ABU2T2X8_9ACTN|nr:DUF190 domain-containing protein [Streptomyces sp. DSM 41527]MDT0455176.1 DUF190 domain-containing protein [Streptomyces sp. DSM 41527]
MTGGTAHPGGAPALRLTVLVGEEDVWHHKPLYAEIVHRARHAGLAGASVFRGIESFGSAGIVHTQRLLSLSEEMPVAIVIVDAEERVRAFLPQLDELLVDGGLVTLDPCEMISYRRTGGKGGTDGTGGAAGTDAGEGGRG